MTVNKELENALNRIVTDTPSCGIDSDMALSNVNDVRRLVDAAYYSVKSGESINYDSLLAKLADRLSITVEQQDDFNNRCKIICQLQDYVQVLELLKSQGRLS